MSGARCSLHDQQSVIASARFRAEAITDCFPYHVEVPRAAHYFQKPSSHIGIHRLGLARPAEQVFHREPANSPLRKETSMPKPDPAGPSPVNAAASNR